MVMDRDGDYDIGSYEDFRACVEGSHVLLGLEIQQNENDAFLYIRIDRGAAWRLTEKVLLEGGRVGLFTGGKEEVLTIHGTPEFGNWDRNIIAEVL